MYYVYSPIRKFIARCEFRERATTDYNSRKCLASATNQQTYVNWNCLGRVAAVELWDGYGRPTSLVH